ncbi:hypothetical protein SRABI27_03733 [Pedobacter sp. Bi27]|uniref:hypothetical protein n=1 Tax=Pedobacter sp. Bi27 TaxID=2822351 RepID=UPI001DC0E7F3|nr:hypothetical protein [Pedobacter sp. Bi27]CAH0279523.1 hypothetical protein SRABI27_03733 [Pedobacter sp. Bi27]
MKKKQKKYRAIRTIIIILLCLIAISNTPPVQFFTLDSYHYQNADGSFTYTEFPAKGLNFEVGITRWERFKNQHPHNPNQTLYRTFQINPFKFWEWWQFIAHYKRYRMPLYSEQKAEKAAINYYKSDYEQNTHYLVFVSTTIKNRFNLPIRQIPVMPKGEVSGFLSPRFPEHLNKPL